MTQIPPFFGVSPFHFVFARGLVIKLNIALNVLQDHQKTLVLTRVEFFMRLYCLCHLTGHVHNRCIARSVSLSDMTGLVAELAFELWNKLGKFLR